MSTGGEVKRTILIVDDSPMFRELETVFLERHANVITASDGTDALIVTRSQRPDVVVTDIAMREMNGDELCREIRSDPDLQRIPVVAVTNGSAEQHEQAVLAGANGVVEKPLKRTVFVQAVNRFLRLTVRGQARAPLDAEVQMATQSGEVRSGWVRNVSRGGMFVESEAILEPKTEVSVEFQVPEMGDTANPTARVVWRRSPEPGHPPGMGLQFLKLDRSLATWLDQYVYVQASGAALA